MSPIDELELILSLIKKHQLPLSPILEYAISEKKEEYAEKVKITIETSVQETKLHNDVLDIESIHDKDEATIELTYEIINAARTPNGGFTKSQLSVLGITWPAPQDWMENKVGTFITPKQLDEFNHIKYVSDIRHKNRSHTSSNLKTYKSIASGENDIKRMAAVINALSHFDVPATPRDVARTVSRSAWGGSVSEDSVDSILKLLPEVECVPWGKYILKDKKHEKD